MNDNILIVEDKDSLREMLKRVLLENHFSVDEARDGIEAAQKIRSRRYLLILSDLRIPHIDGLEILRLAMEMDSENIVIYMTAYGSIEIAVEAMKKGAFDFLPKPVDIHHLLLLVERAKTSRQLRYENMILKEEFSRKLGFPRIIGEDPAFLDVSHALQKAAPTDATVLLCGESGTGKELFARAIHHLSSRSHSPFVAVNCAAIPETLLESELFGYEKGAFTGATAKKPGKFELAGGGTIFLDEIGELSLPLQAKLLRVLQEKTFDRIGGTIPVHSDVRVVAATNRDLQQLVSNKEFREDLYFRLSVFPILIPPLRKRKKDIPLLAENFLEEFRRELKRGPLRLSESALRKLSQYSWPGNIRELQNCMERAVILCEGNTISADDVLINSASLEGSIVDFLDLDGSLAEIRKRATEEVERHAVLKAWKENKENPESTASALGISTKTLLNRIKELRQAGLLPE